MLLKIIEKLIDWTTSFLAWLSKQQVKAVNKRIVNLRKDITRMEKMRDKTYEAFDKKIQRTMNEKEVLENFLNNAEEVML